MATKNATEGKRTGLSGAKRLRPKAALSVAITP